MGICDLLSCPESLSACRWQQTCRSQGLAGRARNMCPGDRRVSSSDGLDNALGQVDQRGGHGRGARSGAARQEWWVRGEGDAFGV
eukprot:gene25228-biopygen16484